ncbi:TetR/AcrR family transcriptional regulator [Nocardiopsis sediminis]|uniref:TetR/AcrR family transcriptional regulator n=1 Tax=Nocardiopsis sediminis TaxID=1778267 RepID=A0ABV8FN44_9ACTN
MAGRKRFDVDTAAEQAMRVFWEHGYAEASMSMLLEATGLGRGSLYATFGDKKELFERSLRLYSASFGTSAKAAKQAPPADPASAAEGYLTTTLDRMADPAVPGGCLVSQSAAQLPDLEPSSRELVRTILDGQREFIQRALTEAGAEPAVAAELAPFVAAVNQGLAVLHRTGAPLEELRLIIRTARDTVAART